MTTFRTNLRGMHQTSTGKVRSFSLCALVVAFILSNHVIAEASDKVLAHVHRQYSGSAIDTKYGQGQASLSLNFDKVLSTIKSREQLSNGSMVDAETTQINVKNVSGNWSITFPGSNRRESGIVQSYYDKSRVRISSGEAAVDNIVKTPFNVALIEKSPSDCANSVLNYNGKFTASHGLTGSYAGCNDSGTLDLEPSRSTSSSAMHPQTVTGLHPYTVGKLTVLTINILGSANPMPPMYAFTTRYALIEAASGAHITPYRIIGGKHRILSVETPARWRRDISKQKLAECAALQEGALEADEICGYLEKTINFSIVQLKVDEPNFHKVFYVFSTLAERPNGEGGITTDNLVAHIWAPCIGGYIGPGGVLPALPNCHNQYPSDAPMAGSGPDQPPY